MPEFPVQPVPVAADPGAVIIHSDETVDASDSRVVSGFGSKEITVIVNVTAAPTGGTPTLQFTLQEVDPGDQTAVFGPTASTVSITGAGVYTATLRTPTGGTVKVSWTVGGSTPEFTGVYSTVLGKVGVATTASGSASIEGTVTADQGEPAALADGWPVQITDGANVLGTGADPLRVDPTGTTAQPVTDNGGSLTVDTPQLPAALVGGRLDVVVGAALPAGTNNIGDVDVLSVPAPLSTTGGGTEATSLRVTVANDSTGLLSVDDNGGSLTVDSTQLPAALVGGRLDVVVGAALPAGTNNIGDVDIASVPAPLSTTGGGTEATALRVTVANDSTGLLSVDDNGGSLTVDSTQLPAALVGARLDVNNGAWLGSTAPTVGQKTMANSVPTVLASDQTAIPVTDNGGALTVDGTVTANQGTAAAASGGWPVKVTDGTNVAAVKAASTPAVDTDPALVVAISPNNPILASNPSVGPTGDPIPLEATLIGGSDGSDLRAIQTLSDGRLVVTDGGDPLAVEGPLTDTELRASAVPVSGPLTDTQLRASPVDVSLVLLAPLPVRGGYSDGDSDVGVGVLPIAGTDGSNLQLVQTDSGGRLVVTDAGAGFNVTGAIEDGDPLPAPPNGLLVMGTDGVDAHILRTHTDGLLAIAGARSNDADPPGNRSLGTLPAVATAADPSYTEGNQVALSTDLGGALRIAGSIVASNPSVGDNNDTAPTSSTQIGGTDGTNLQAAHVFDADSGGGTQYVLGTILRKSASGGSVEAGTSADPLRVDPTGTTAQPVTDNGGSLTVDSAQLPAALVSGRLDVVVGAALPAGTNNIGDVDVLTVPAPLSTAGGGTEATALRVTVANDSTGLLSVDDNGGSLTVDGTVTANQGTAAVTANAWPIKVTDGTDIAAVVPASTAAVATDPALVVAISPNNVATTRARLDSDRRTIDVPSTVTIDGESSVYRDFGSGVVRVEFYIGTLTAPGDVSVTVKEVDAAGNPIEGIFDQGVFTTVAVAGLASAPYRIEVQHHLRQHDAIVVQWVLGSGALLDDVLCELYVTPSLTSEGVTGFYDGPYISKPRSALQLGGQPYGANNTFGGYKAVGVHNQDTDFGQPIEEAALGVSLRKPGSGGSVAFGTDTAPIRVDPTGTTAQPVTDNGGSLTVDVGTALPAGTNNIGDVDVLSVPAPLSTTGGGTEATALRVTVANDSTGLLSVDDNGGSLTVDSTQLPAALVGARLDVNNGAWLGSTAPTVGQKTMANSLPVVISSDQSAVTVTGTVTASNPSVGSTGAAVPASATQIGGSDGTNLQAPRVFDADSGGGTQYVLGTILRKSASGGSVEAGTPSAPLTVENNSDHIVIENDTITAPGTGSLIVRNLRSKDVSLVVTVGGVTPVPPTVGSWLTDGSAYLADTTPPIDLNTDYTICGWFRPDSDNFDGGQHKFFGIKDGSGFEDTTTMQNDEVIVFGVSPITSDTDSAGSQTVVDTWIHIALQRDANNVRVYANGVNVATADVPVGSRGAAVVMTVGDVGSFSGMIAYQRGWQAVLTAGEITAEMNSAVAVRTANLEFDLTTVQADGVGYDASGNNNDLTETGGTFVWDTESPTVDTDPVAVFYLRQVDPQTDELIDEVGDSTNSSMSISAAGTFAVELVAAQSTAVLVEWTGLGSGTLDDVYATLVEKESNVAQGWVDSDVPYAVNLRANAAGRLAVAATFESDTGTLANVASSATTVTLLASNSARKGATIVNDSTQVLFVKFGTTASSTSYTVRMVANAYYEVPYGYTGRIDGIWASANGNARVTEIS